MKKHAETTKPPVVVILNNEIMPYRVPLFRQLHQRQRIAPLVLYSMQRSDERDWSLSHLKLTYPHEILRGITFKLPKASYGEYRSIRLNPALLLRLWSLRPRAIVAYEYSIPAFITLIYSLLTGCKILTWSEMTVHTSRNLSRGQRLMRWLILSRADAVIATSRAACEYFSTQGVSQSRIFLAPQTFDVEYFRQQARKQRQENHPLTALYIGYLNERKGVRYLISAFKEVLQSMPHARLLIAGSGNLQAELEAMVVASGLSDAVTFLGFVEQEALPQIYAQSDVFVLPTLEDTFAVAAGEALASGLALVCSCYAGIASHLTDGKDAFIVNPENTEQMSQRIQQLLASPQQRQNFVQAAQPFLEQCAPHYNATVFEDAILTALREKS